jgi:hypothetical protein
MAEKTVAEICNYPVDYFNMWDYLYIVGLTNCAATSKIAE